MLLIIALIFVAVMGQGVSQQSISTLRGTKQLNYTFYHIHNYPEPENMTIYIYYRQTGTQLHTLLSSFVRTLERIHNSTKDFANKPKPTFIEHQPIFSDFGSKQLILSSTIVLQVLDENNLAIVADEIQQISKKQSIQIASIQREYWNLFDYKIEEQKARVQAQQKGRDICKKYFGMRYKRLESFQKWRDIIQEKYNQTAQQESESDEFIGDLSEVYDEIDLIEYRQRFVQGNQVFKCTIICENVKTITPKYVQKLIKRPESKQKLSKIEAQHISKKSKKINLKKYQKQLQGTEL